jgi:hypothetical protein
MNKQKLIGLWKLAFLPGVWIKLPLWISLIILGLDGQAPEWDELGLLLAIVPVIITIVEFANRYVDRDEDRIYYPGNPLATGEIDVGTAKKALIVLNILCGFLFIAISMVSLNYPLIAVLAVGWFIAVAYSLPPFKIKATFAALFVVSIGDALQSLAAWLSVASLNRFIIAFAVFWFFLNLGLGVTIKFRKTIEAFNRGQIRLDNGSSIYNIRLIDVRLKVKHAVALEALFALGAFILVPIFWHLGIFGSTFSILLLTLPLVCAITAVFLRIRGPFKNGMKSLVFLTMAWIFVMLSLLAVAISGQIHWGFAILACITVLVVALLLFRTVQTFGIKAVAAPWQEL